MGFKKRFMDQLTKPVANAMRLQAEAFGELQRAQSAAADGGPDPAESPPAAPPGEPDPSEATQEDWLRLARFCNSTVTKLQMAFPEINPRNCIVRIYRVLAKPFRGSSRIPPGIIPDLTFEWPFNLAEIEQHVAEECGGGAYELRVYDGSTRVASVPLTLGIPPKQFRPDGGDNGENEPDKLTRLRNRIAEEELNKTLLEKQGERQAVQRQVEGAVPRPRPIANPDEDGGEQPPRTFMLEPAVEPQPDIESEVEARVAKRLGDFELRQELKEFTRTTDEKFNKLAEMVSKAASGDGGGGRDAVLIETIRGAFTAMQSAFTGNQNPTTGLQTELMKMQMENQRSNMEFLLRMMELKGAGGGMGGSETLEAIRTGIELAADRGGGEQEGDWLQTGVKALTNLVAGEALKKADQSGQQVDPAVVQAQAEIIAKQTVAKMMAEAQARRAAAAAVQAQPGVPAQQTPAPAPPAGGVMRRRAIRRPAPGAAVQGSDDVVLLPPEQPEQAMPAAPSVPAQGAPQAPAPAPAAVPQPPATATDEQKKVIVGQLLGVVAREMDERPYKSHILALARAYLPLDLQAELLNADEGTARDILLKYASGTYVAALGIKVATNPHVKAWLQQQVQFLRADLAAYRAAVLAQQKGA